MRFPAGIIEKDDIHPRKHVISSDRKINDDKKIYFYKKVPMILYTFMETFIGVFIYCFPTKKNQETYIGLKLDFFKLYAWIHSTMKNIQYSIPFSPQELCFRVILSAY